MPTQLNGASVASLQGGQTALSTGPPGYQAYVPHNSQLRFLKTKVVLARVLEDRYNIATKTKRGVVIQDELSEPENGYEYVDID
ncbi:unnamed protein product [Sphagnum balticum]